MKKNDYSGMTVNERLFVSNLIHDFDVAIKKQDKNEIINILKMIDLSEASIEAILKKYKL